MAKKKTSKKLTGAAKKAFVARMAAARARRGHPNPPFPLAKNPRSNPARNPPRKNPPKAARNAPVKVLDMAVDTGGAAIVGGILTFAAAKLIGRATGSPTGGYIAGVFVPLGIGLLATKLRHPKSQAIAAGCLGVAGVGLASAISDAIHSAQNPPLGFDGDLYALANPAPESELDALPMPIGFTMAR